MGNFMQAYRVIRVVAKGLAWAANGAGKDTANLRPPLVTQRSFAVVQPTQQTKPRFPLAIAVVIAMACAITLVIYLATGERTQNTTDSTGIQSVSTEGDAGDRGDDTPARTGDVYVRGYTKKNGTYVAPYTRTGFVAKIGWEE